MAEYGDVVDPFHLVNHQKRYFCCHHIHTWTSFILRKAHRRGCSRQVLKGDLISPKKKSISPWPVRVFQVLLNTLLKSSRTWSKEVEEFDQKQKRFSYQATFSLVDGNRLVQHLSEHIDRARNFVCHKLHHCGPVRHHHVQVSLINICETRGSQF